MVLVGERGAESEKKLCKESEEIDPRDGELFC